MGLTCSKPDDDLMLLHQPVESDPRRNRRRRKNAKFKGGHYSTACYNYHKNGIHKTDPHLFSLQQQSIGLRQDQDVTSNNGQHHLLFKQQQKGRHSTPYSKSVTRPAEPLGTRLVIRRQSVRNSDEGMSGTHIYAVRWPRHAPLQLGQPEQPPVKSTKGSLSVVRTRPTPVPSDAAAVDRLFHPVVLSVTPQREVTDWVTVSEEHDIYVADIGLTNEDCDRMVTVTEQVCRGQYAAYTYAKQTLGCREYPPLAAAVHQAVHTATHAILRNALNKDLCLDDREPHMVKYDVTKKERQKLAMHTDKSEWTFLIALSDGCGMDYEGGGTFFECLDATVHVQRGHAVIFPGKLRHCGQRISAGLRFLLVGFLVDKSAPPHSSSSDGDFPNAMGIPNVP